MSDTPLQRALAWFVQRDEMGGFCTAARTLFPGWEPKRSCKAPHREENSPSFSVYQGERDAWRFKDFATGEQGGLVGFAMLAGMDGTQAARWVIEQAGSEATGKLVAFPSAQRTEPSQAKPETIRPIPPSARKTWMEGVDYLTGRSTRIEKLAELRGWPVEWAQYMAESAAISMPLYHGERTIAFLVEAPEGERGRTKMREAGFHCRLHPRPGDKKASWRFVPNEKEHGQSTPALPYIIGGSWFDSANLLVILGGQWDALTFAFAAGWLGEGRQWPEGACVIGMRGDSSATTFLQHYDCFWPRAANCLLLPDGDASGERWFTGANAFATRLSARCRKVAVVRCGSHKDFNDLYRAEQTTPAQVAELLARYGMAMKGGASK